jgi:hypothetical protein
MSQAAGKGWWWRAWLIAALGGAGALAVYLLLEGHARPSAARSAIAALLTTGLLLVGFTVERERWRWSLLFGLAGGAVMGLVVWWNGLPDAGWSGDMGPWRLLCGLLAVAIAVPFFQTSRDHGRWAIDYPALHCHAWTAAIVWCAAWAFVGATFLTAWLLAELFQLIGIGLLHDALDEEAIIALLGGAAFGGGVGVLRDRERLVDSLQKILRAGLVMLAPALGAGLLIFLASTPFTGLAPLWAATRSTTPILLACIIGGLVLVNAVLDDGSESESTSPPLRFGAMAIGLSLLPLAVIAAVSTGLRIDQHGLTPDRLWAVVFVAVATAFGLAYFVALVRRRIAWGVAVRVANMRLGLGVLGIALLLATPLVGFGALSARDQEARLLSGRIATEQFDWPALAFDFGSAGRRVLERLARGADPGRAAEARKALAAKDRWSYAETRRGLDTRGEMEKLLRILPARVALPPQLGRLLAGEFNCDAGRGGNECILRYAPDAAEVDLVQIAAKCDTCLPTAARLVRRTDGEWTRQAVPDLLDGLDEPARKALAARLRAAARQGDFGARAVERRQYFIGGEPVGEVFDQPPP